MTLDTHDNPGGPPVVPDPAALLDDVRRQVYATRAAVETFLDGTALAYDDLLVMALRVWLERADEAALRSTVARLRTHGITAEVIAGVLHLPLPVIEAVLEHANLSPVADQIAALHARGFTPTMIARQLDLKSREQVYRVLARLGQKPNRKRKVRTMGDTRRIVELYRDGVSYTVIARRLGLSLDQVRSALKTEHRNGRLPEYGTRTVVRHG